MIVISKNSVVYERVKDKYVCRFGRGCTHHEFDAFHRENFWHPSVSMINVGQLKTHYVCNECGFPCLSLQELQIHLQRKTAWSNVSLIGCHVCCLMGKDWVEGTVLGFHDDSKKHLMRTRVSGEKFWILMKKCLFYISERPYATPKSLGSKTSFNTELCIPCINKEQINCNRGGVDANLVIQSPSSSPRTTIVDAAACGAISYDTDTISSNRHPTARSAGAPPNDDEPYDGMTYPDEMYLVEKNSTNTLAGPLSGAVNTGSGSKDERQLQETSLLNANPVPSFLTMRGPGGDYDMADGEGKEGDCFNMPDLDPSPMETWVYVDNISLDYAFAQSVLFKIYGGVIQETGHRTRGHLCLTEQDRYIAKKGQQGNLLYGEVLPRGLNKAFDKYHLDAGTATSLVDLGMGTGKVAIQAFLQYRNLSFVYGIELSAGRFKVAEEALMILVALLGTSRFTIEHEPGKCIVVREIARGNFEERVLHFELGNLLNTSSIVKRADIVMLETELPAVLHPELCLLLAHLPLSARTLSYLNLKDIWPSALFPFEQLAINSSNADRFQTSWSVFRGHHFLLWNRRQLAPDEEMKLLPLMSSAVQLQHKGYNSTGPIGTADEYPQMESTSCGCFPTTHLNITSTILYPLRVMFRALQMSVIATSPIRFPEDEESNHHSLGCDSKARGCGNQDLLPPHNYGKSWSTGNIQKVNSNRQKSSRKWNKSESTAGQPLPEKRVSGADGSCNVTSRMATKSPRPYEILNTPRDSSRLSNSVDEVPKVCDNTGQSHCHMNYVSGTNGQSESKRTKDVVYNNSNNSSVECGGNVSTKKDDDGVDGSVCGDGRQAESVDVNPPIPEKRQMVNQSRNRQLSGACSIAGELINANVSLKGTKEKTHSSTDHQLNQMNCISHTSDKLSSKKWKKAKVRSSPKIRQNSGAAGGVTTNTSTARDHMKSTHTVPALSLLPRELSASASFNVDATAYTMFLESQDMVSRPP